MLLTCILLMTGWSLLESFSLVFAWWEVCPLMYHQIDFSHLGVTCNLLDVICCCLWILHFLCKLPDFAYRKPLKINTTVIVGFRHKFFIFQEKPKDVMMQDVCSFLWVFIKTHLSLYKILLLIQWSVALVKACKQVKPCSHFICFGLEKIFILRPYCVQAKFISWQAPGNILIHTKVTTPCYSFLALLWLRKHCKLTI